MQLSSTFCFQKLNDNGQGNPAKSLPKIKPKAHEKVKKTFLASYTSNKVSYWPCSAKMPVGIGFATNFRSGSLGVHPLWKGEVAWEDALENSEASDAVELECLLRLSSVWFILKPILLEEPAEPEMTRKSVKKIPIIFQIDLRSFSNPKTASTTSEFVLFLFSLLMFLSWFLSRGLLKSLKRLINSLCSALKLAWTE